MTMSREIFNSRWAASQRDTEGYSDTDLTRINDLTYARVQGLDPDDQWTDHDVRSAAERVMAEWDSGMDTAPVQAAATPPQQTYMIEVWDGGVWVPAPGEAGGWSLEEAQRAVESGLYWLDGTPIDPQDVQIVPEE